MLTKKVICTECGESYPDGWPHTCSESTETAGSIASPWPAKDIVKKLVEATEILLNDKNYDGHGWEQIHAAKKEAEDWLMQ